VKTAGEMEITSEDTLLLLNRATVVMHSVRAVAHELNNVFQTISGAAELMGFNPDFPPSLASKLQTFARQTTRGRELVGAVSDLARTDLARGSVANVARAFERVAQLRAHEQTRAGIDMTTTLTVDSSRDVAADPLDVQVMLLNLIILAEQSVASAPTKTIEVRAISDIETCRVIVADSGSGEGDGADAAGHGPERIVRSMALAAIELLVSRHRGSFERRANRTGMESILALQRAHADAPPRR
jgi:signal transduction histidine kinase